MIIGMGTDSGGTTIAFSVAWTAHTEMRDMVTCGLSPMEAIMAATSVNAEILGLDDLGMVAEGKNASFVLLDGNPLDDINNTRRISQVYLAGQESRSRGTEGQVHGWCEVTEAEGVRVPFPVHFECLKGRMAGFNRLGVRRFQCPLRDACNLQDIWAD